VRLTLEILRKIPNAIPSSFRFDACGMNGQENNTNRSGWAGDLVLSFASDAVTALILSSLLEMLMGL
jgi:hypothetical protein